jgi:hypothetical protein
VISLGEKRLLLLLGQSDLTARQHDDFRREKGARQRIRRDGWLVRRVQANGQGEKGNERDSFHDVCGVRG